MHQLPLKNLKYRMMDPQLDPPIAMNAMSSLKMMKMAVHPASLATIDVRSSAILDGKGHQSGQA
jgi:hypothetical protein